MNKKGQALVLVVLLIPLILAIMAFVFDISLMYKEKNNLRSVAKQSLIYIVKDNKDIEEVKQIIKENDNKININEIDSSSIYLSKDVSSVFGKVLGFNKYHIKIKMTGLMKEEKIEFTEKG